MERQPRLKVGLVKHKLKMLRTKLCYSKVIQMKVILYTSAKKQQNKSLTLLLHL